MDKALDLISLAHELGPKFADGAEERDEADAFVSANYDILKSRKVFSALVPRELGGGGATHSQMCAFLRVLAGYCGSTALALLVEHPYLQGLRFHFFLFP